MTLKTGCQRGLKPRRSSPPLLPSSSPTNGHFLPLSFISMADPSTSTSSSSRHKHSHRDKERKRSRSRDRSDKKDKKDGKKHHHHLKERSPDNERKHQDNKRRRKEEEDGGLRVMDDEDDAGVWVEKGVDEVSRAILTSPSFPSSSTFLLLSSSCWFFSVCRPHRP